MQMSFVMLLFSDQISGRGKSFQEGKLAQGGRPPVEESQHFNQKIAKSATKVSNSVLQKPLKLSKLCIFSEMLTAGKTFVKFQCFDEKITKSMFFILKH